MQWINKRSSNVEDRRGSSTGKGIALGGGIGGIVILAIVWLLGGDPSQLSGMLDMQNLGSTNTEYVATAEEDSLAQFVSMVLVETEEVWSNYFRKIGKTYREPKLVLFTGATSSACGSASQATGPFYCPGDEKVYLDLSFYKEMKTRFKASGDFAFAYVVAHEVGHHVQHLLGTLNEYESLRRRSNQKQANALTVRLELQADFYAGIWANHSEKLYRNLDPNDIRDALNAASAIGDDRIQKQSQGYVVPDSFTHGTSAQRSRWFEKGYKTGDVSQGNTFATNDL